MAGYDGCRNLLQPDKEQSMNDETIPVQDSLENRVKNMTDDDLFMELQLQVNKARNCPHGHDRDMARAVGKEMKRRGWISNFK